MVEDAFSTAKAACIAALGKPDKSRKGGVDDEAWPFIEAINALPEYYTTSSCAGRINVFREPASGKKHEAEWLFVTHQEAEPSEVLEALKDLPDDTIWLRMEAPIFHVACKDQEAAERLLKLCQGAGWKRSGIISTGGKKGYQQRVMVEILGNERIDTPLAGGGALFFDERFVRFLVEKANEKLHETRLKLDDLTEMVRKNLS